MRVLHGPLAAAFRPLTFALQRLQILREGLRFDTVKECKELQAVQER